jgi:hypothetical protein
MKEIRTILFKNVGSTHTTFLILSKTAVYLSTAYKISVKIEVQEIKL